MISVKDESWVKTNNKFGLEKQNDEYYLWRFEWKQSTIELWESKIVSRLWTGAWRTNINMDRSDKDK